MNSVVTSYEVRELFPLGKGGMGTTYLGCARGVGGFERLVAIKRLHEHLQEDPEACVRLLAEAELAGCVHHSNVVAVQHVDRDARGAFLVLDYVEGGSMKELMRQAAPGRIPEPIALRLMLDCLAGLDAIHNAKDHRGRALNILHRDISPENILVGLDGMARLTDFGIARSSQRPALTAPSQLVGKLGFMAPEYVDRGNLGPPLDIYSLGVTFWMLLVGKNPWRGLEEAQLLAKLLTEGVPPLPQKRVISSNLREVVEKACAMDASDRYQTAREMAAAIESCGAAVAEHSEVAMYADKQFECSTSERRLEAAQLLNRASSRPPSSSALREIRGAESLEALLPIVSAGKLPPLPLVNTSGVGAAFGIEDGTDTTREELSPSNQIWGTTRKIGTQVHLDGPGFLDERSTVTRGLAVSVHDSRNPSPSRIRRLLTGVTLGSVLGACGLLAVGYFGGRTTSAEPDADRSPPMAGSTRSPADVSNEEGSFIEDSTAQKGLSADSSTNEISQPTGKKSKAGASEPLESDEGAAETPAPHRQATPTRVRSAASLPSDSEIVSRNPYRGR